MYNQKGFTLIELIIVIVIIAVATGIIFPVYFSMKPKFRLNGAARQIQGDLMWARMQAVSQNNQFRIFFFNTVPTNDHKYQILDDDNNNDNPDSDELIITKDLQTSYQDVVFDPIPSSDPIFKPRGTLWPLGFTITLKNSSGTKDVTVSSAGRIKIN